MQAVEREAGRLVRKFHAAPPQQQADAAIALVEFCDRQPLGREWRDAGGRVGIVTAIVQAVKIGDANLQRNAVRALEDLMSDHFDNQSAAAAAGAIPLLIQLTTSSNNALLLLGGCISAVSALGILVIDHHDNQSAAAAVEAIPHLLQLTKSSNAALQQESMHALGFLVENHCGNRSAAAAVGAIPHLLQLTKSSNAHVQLKAVVTLGILVNNQHDNQSAAAAIGTIPHMLQLSKSSDAALQLKAVVTLGILVINHHDNQSAAAAVGAIPHLLQLTKSSYAALQGSAVEVLGTLVADHTDNQSAAGVAGAVEYMCNLLSSKFSLIAAEAAGALNDLCSLTSNARRAVSIGAVALLLQLKACPVGGTALQSTGDRHISDQLKIKHRFIDGVLAKLAQVPTAPPNEPVCVAAASAATVPFSASARHLAPGSRVRIEGLQGRPEMNGRTGVICGAFEQAKACFAGLDIDAGVFNEASGRWPVEVDADGVNGTSVPCQIVVRPVNLFERKVSGSRA
jgi:hypothetical protein